jgi:5-methylcytosine-specific restriction endonuclease McrA
MALLKICSDCFRSYEPWTRNNRGRCRDCLRRYEGAKRARRANRARSSMAWQNARAAARKRDGERCQRCGATEGLEVHHITPLSKGGAEFDLSNLTTLCQECHVAVGGRLTIVGARRHTRKPAFRETHTQSETQNEIEPLVG